MDRNCLNRQNFDNFPYIDDSILLIGEENDPVAIPDAPANTENFHTMEFYSSLAATIVAALSESTTTAATTL